MNDIENENSARIEPLQIDSNFCETSGNRDETEECAEPWEIPACEKCNYLEMAVYHGEVELWLCWKCFEYFYPRACRHSREDARTEWEASRWNEI